MVPTFVIQVFQRHIKRLASENDGIVGKIQRKGNVTLKPMDEARPTYIRGETFISSCCGRENPLACLGEEEWDLGVKLLLAVEAHGEEIGDEFAEATVEVDI